jgi:hypothetical protein
MYLAIGDVVRDRRDLVLCTVARIDINEGRVVLSVPGGFPRPAAADDLEIVSRYSRPATKRLRFMAVFLFLVGLLAAYIAGYSVQLLDGNWLLTLMASLGAYQPFEAAFRLYRRLTGPRRYRI